MVAMVSVGVMLGMNLASSGIERIQGPVSQQSNPPAWTVQQQQQQLQQVPVPTQAIQQQVLNQVPIGQTNTLNQQVASTNMPSQPDYIPLVPTTQPTVDRLANTTGGVLESVSHKGMEWVVSLFTSILD